MRSFTFRACVFFVLIGVWLLAGCASRPIGLLRPNAVAVAPDDSLYVMDRGNYRVVHLAADGKFLGAFGKLGTGPNDIYEGWNIKLDSASNVYISNFSYYDQDEYYLAHEGVKVFSPQGQLVREVGEQHYDSAEDADENELGVYGLDIDSQGRVYVGDYYGRTVRVFDAQGDQIATFFGEKGSGVGQFISINEVAVDDQHNFLYVLDYTNSYIQQFELSVLDSGALTVTHRLTFGSYGRAPGQFAYLQYMTVDRANGRVYVGDMGNRRVQAFDSQGQYLNEFAPPENDWQVMGLDVGGDGAVYATDTLNNVIWVFEPDGQLRSRIEVKP